MVWRCGFKMSPQCQSLETRAHSYCCAAIKWCYSWAEEFPLVPGVSPWKRSGGGMVSIGISPLSVSECRAEAVAVAVVWEKRPGRACELKRGLAEEHFLLDPGCTEVATAANARGALETFSFVFLLFLAGTVSGGTVPPPLGREEGRAGYVVVLMFRACNLPISLLFRSWNAVSFS